MIERRRHIFAEYLSHCHLKSTQMFNSASPCGMPLIRYRQKFKRHLNAESKFHLIEMTSEKYRHGGDVNSEADSSCFYYITVSGSPWRRQTFETVQKMFLSPSHAGSFRGLVMKSNPVNSTSGTGFLSLTEFWAAFCRSGNFNIERRLFYWGWKFCRGQNGM
ncbi:hypothetical protein CEXT_195601 [Caerostris extrusa]|uniref:Uncharacterized protein n=1 Tax=Caerostris extrusa TaxID=172846 RepID=A0AAV4PUK3_CAEEX|nr:hypothetical protein CEXT_195601 [Caerostris extrusa]